MRSALRLCSTAIAAEWPARQKEICKQRDEQTSYGLRAITSGEWYLSSLARAAAISAASAVSDRGIDRDKRRRCCRRALTTGPNRTREDMGHRLFGQDDRYYA